MRVASAAVFAVSGVVLPTALAAKTSVHRDLLRRADRLSAAANPITQIVKLLQDMEKQIEKDMEEDEKIHTKMECWCKKHEKGAAATQKEYQDRIDLLESEIQSYTASAAADEIQSKQMAEDLETTTGDLKEARDRRTKEIGEFQKKEVEYTENITALKGAIEVLKKFQDGGGASLVTVATNLQQKIKGHQDLLDDLVQAAKAENSGNSGSGVDTKFLQAQNKEGNDIGYAAYGSQSGQVFGILSQMLETFETELVDLKQSHTQVIKGLDSLIKNKEEQAGLLEESSEAKKLRAAESAEKASEAKAEIARIQADGKNLLEFMQIVNTKCPAHEQEWQKRVEGRMAELKAINEAVQVLQSDENRDLMKKATAFVQLRKSNSVFRRHHAHRGHAARTGRGASSSRKMSELQRAAALLRQSSSPVMSALATGLEQEPKEEGYVSAQKRFDFSSVVNRIATLIQDLKKSKADESAERDEDIEAYNTTSESLAARTASLEQKESEKNQLETDIGDESSGKVKQLKEEEMKITDAQGELAKLDEEFQQGKTDRAEAIQTQKDAVSILKQAMVVLKRVYSSVSEASFVQIHELHGEHSKKQPEGGLMGSVPADMKEYKNASQGGSSVLAMLENIQKEATTEIANLQKEDAEAITEYQEQKAAQQSIIHGAENAMIEFNGEKARLDQELLEVSDEIADLSKQVSVLTAEKKELQVKYDYWAAHFAERQRGYDDEITALQEATAILKGMDASSIAPYESSAAIGDDFYKP